MWWRIKDVITETLIFWHYHIFVDGKIPKHRIYKIPLTDMYTSGELLMSSLVPEYGDISYIVSEAIARIGYREGNNYRFVSDNAVDHDHDFLGLMVGVQIYGKIKIPPQFMSDYSSQELKILDQLPLQKSKIPFLGPVLTDFRLFKVFESMTYSFVQDGQVTKVKEFEHVLKASVQRWGEHIWIEGKSKLNYNQNQIRLVEALNSLKEAQTNIKGR